MANNWKQDGKWRWNKERKERGNYDFDILIITKYAKNILVYTYPYKYKVSVYQELSDMKEEKKVEQFETEKEALAFAMKYMREN